MQKQPTIKAQLCGCNNCDTIMIDQNPDDQKELTVEARYAKEMEFIEDKFGRYCVCPVCKTDDYLTDITSKTHLYSFILAQEETVNS